AGLLLCCALLSPAAAVGEGFTIRSAELDRVGADYVLNADVRYDFSAAAVEALENSVPLTLVLSFRLVRVRPYWWNETVVEHRHQLQIRYQPLGQLFQLNFDDRENSQSYTTIHSLLDAMGTIRRLPVVAADKLLPGIRYRAELSVRLDIETLPLPLRPTAYLSPSWYLSSPTYRWPFAKSD
ncbi:MAG: DUF4390 domain-containing protein, partial [Gammaproteobacteria bacterium]|nr:DUF4390 domain-containing protein [Gammaproteobacteria bacterium]